MQMSLLARIGAGILLFVGAVFVLRRGRRSSSRPQDLGVISHQWIAQHRATWENRLDRLGDVLNATYRRTE